jgi:hypothetical protein
MKFEDDMRFEDELRRAFKAEDPGEAFTQRVLDRVRKDTASPAAAPAPKSSAQSSSQTRTSAGSHANWRVTLAFAASLMIAVGGAAWVRHARYVEEGERARAQVLAALRVTSEKLSVVRSVVNETQDAADETQDPH